MLCHVFRRTLPRTGETQEIQIGSHGENSWAEEWLTKPLGPTTFRTSYYNLNGQEAEALILSLQYHTGFRAVP